MNNLFNLDRFLFGLLSLVAVWVCSGTANAFDGYIEVTNDTGYDVYYLYVSHEDSTEWEEDVLEDDILPDGQSVRVNLYGYSSSIFDVRAKDEDGDTYTLYGIDVSVDDLRLTLAHLDSDETVSGGFDGYIEVTNNTGYDVYYLYVSHENSDEWEEDVLDDDILENGQTVRVDLTNFATPIFDIRAKDEDGDTYTIYGVDVSTDDLTLTLKHID